MADSEVIKAWHHDGCTLRLLSCNHVTDQSDILDDDVGYFWQYTPEQFLKFGYASEMYDRYGDGFLECVSMLKERLK